MNLVDNLIFIKFMDKLGESLDTFMKLQWLS